MLFRKFLFAFSFKMNCKSERMYSVKVPGRCGIEMIIKRSCKFLSVLVLLALLLSVAIIERLLQMLKWSLGIEYN